MLIFLLLMGLQAVPAAGNHPPLYVVGPNDVLTITVFNQPQLSGKFAVEADGSLAFPLLGRVKIGGMSIPAVEDEMRKGLAAGYLRDPQVSITVEQYRSQQIFVMGEVRQPGSLQFTGSMTLIEALARVGSTTDHAGAQAVIIRSPHGSAEHECTECRHHSCGPARSAERGARAERCSAGGRHDLRPSRRDRVRIGPCPVGRRVCHPDRDDGAAGPGAGRWCERARLDAAASNHSASRRQAGHPRR
jgi:protein involved in polysaccharide export with SLBB domain